MLLLGTSVLVYAAMPAAALAQNECGPAPPGGGTVTCPAGNYPNGIAYPVVVDDLTVVLEPGVTTDATVEVRSSGAGIDLRLEGGTNTSINATLNDGVLVDSPTGSIFVGVDDVANTGASIAHGIFAGGLGTVTVIADTVVTAGDHSAGIIAREGFLNLGDPPGTPLGASVTVNSVATSGVHSIGISADGEHGDVVVDAGTVTTTGFSSRGIFALGADREIIVTSDSVTTSGGHSIGIYALGLSDPDDPQLGGSILVDSNSVTTTGNRATGIHAEAPVNDITVNSNTISTSGDHAHGIEVLINPFAPYGPGSGNILIDSGTITTLGFDSDGIIAIGADDITITSGSLSTRGYRGVGIYASSDEFGNVVITSGTVATAGNRSSGISANAHHGDVFVESGAVTTAGDNAAGILASSYSGSVEVTSTDLIQTGGEGAAGIVAVSTHAPITIDSRAVSTSGRFAHGISASSDNDNVVITSGTVATGGDFSLGISATADEGDVVIESGTVTTAGGGATGMFAETSEGQITIDSGTVSTSGANADGIEAIVHGTGSDKYGPHGGGPIVITSDSVTTTGARSEGINADGTDDITVDSGIVNTSGDDAHGIQAFTRGGSLRIESGTVSTGGDNAGGIVAIAPGSFKYGLGSVLVTSDSVTTAGEDSDGILADARADITIDSGIVRTSGADSGGIVASASIGSVRVTSDRVSTEGDGAGGILASSDYSSVVITNSNLVQTGGTGSTGIIAYSPNSTATIESGTVVTSGDQSPGIDAYAEGGVTITSGSVTTLGANSDGIVAIGADGVTIASTGVGTSGTSALGIRAASLGGAINIASGSVTTAGSGAIGILAATGMSFGVSSPSQSPADLTVVGGAEAAPVAVPPDISITSTTVTTAGDGAIGISATTEDGDIFIESGAVTTAGNSATGIFAQTVYGQITIDSGTVSTSGANADGIDAIVTGAPFDPYGPSYPYGGGDDGGPIVITSDSVVTIGTGSEGVRASGNDLVHIESGIVGTSGDAATGIFAETTLGQITIDSGTVSTSGANAAGIDATVHGRGFGKYGARNDGGPIVITSDSVATTGAGSDGITATGGDDIIIDSGMVNTSGDGAGGIGAFSNTGYIQIESVTVSTRGDQAGGILASATGNIIYGIGTVRITSESVTTIGEYSKGIHAFAQAGVTVVSGIVRTSGANSAGIVADAGIGGATVTSDQLSTEGNLSVGIFASSDRGGVEVTNTDYVRTSGDGATGILAETGQHGITIDSGTVTTEGLDASGIVAVAHSYPSSKYSFAGPVVVTSDSVTVSGGGTFGAGTAGISAQSDYSDVTVISGSVVTAGDFVRGIFALASPDPVDDVAQRTLDGAVDVTSAAVTTSGEQSPGIGAYGANATVVSGTVTTTGADSPGIVSLSFGVRPPAEGGTASADSVSLPVTEQILGPNGGTHVTSGSVTTSGANSSGIDADADVGDTEVYSTGTLTTSGADSHGIIANSDQGFALVDANAISVTGAGSDAIVITSVTSGTVVVRGLVQSAGGFSIQANGGAAAVRTTASGTIRGAIDLTDNADTLDNAGTFDAIGASAFGAGADRFDNSGTTRSVNGAAVLGGLETFNNGGLVDLGDGAPDDRLTIGDFNGLPGSRLAVDVDFTARVADVLVTGVATGSTTVAVNASGAQFGFHPGILVVDATAGTPSTAFSLAGGNVSNGYVTSGLIFDAPNFNFLLVNAPNQPIFETAMVGGMTLDYWHQSADAVEAQLEGARAPGRGSGAGNLVGGGRFGGWIQVFAGETEREATQSFTSGGAATTFDVSYEQDFEGIQAGVDHESGPLILGLTVGVGQSESRFEASPGALEMDAKNLGLYLAFASGNFYLNLLAKVDWMDIETNPGPGLAAAFDATAYGARGVAGFRFDLGNLYLEPSVGLSWVTVDIDDYRSGGATISFDNATSLRGTAGLRIGGIVATGGDGVLSPFAGVRVVEEFGGANRNDFFLGTNLNLTEDGPGTHGEASVGLTFTSGSVEAFIRGELDFGNDVEGRAVRGGVRVRF